MATVKLIHGIDFAGFGMKVFRDNPIVETDDATAAALVECGCFAPCRPDGTLEEPKEQKVSDLNLEQAQDRKVFESEPQPESGRKRLCGNLEQMPEERGAVRNMKMADLKAYATSLGADVSKLRRKADILAVIESMERGPEDGC